MVVVKPLLFELNIVHLLTHWLGNFDEANCNIYVALPIGKNLGLGAIRENLFQELQ